MTKEDNESFKNSIKCWICDNDYVDNDVKIRYYCDVTGEYRGSVHRDYNINLELNHVIPVVFQSIKNYVSQLIMEELRKFNLQRSVIPNGLEKCMSLTVYNKLNFMDRFQFLSS